MVGRVVSSMPEAPNIKETGRMYIVQSQREIDEHILPVYNTVSKNRIAL